MKSSKRITNWLPLEKSRKSDCSYDSTVFLNYWNVVKCIYYLKPQWMRIIAIIAVTPEALWTSKGRNHQLKKQKLEALRKKFALKYKFGKLWREKEGKYEIQKLCDSGTCCFSLLTINRSYHSNVQKVIDRTCSLVYPGVTLSEPKQRTFWMFELIHRNSKP